MRWRREELDSTGGEMARPLLREPLLPQFVTHETARLDGLSRQQQDRINRAVWVVDSCPAGLGGVRARTTRAGRADYGQ